MKNVHNDMWFIEYVNKIVWVSTISHRQNAPCFSQKLYFISYLLLQIYN